MPFEYGQSLLEFLSTDGFQSHLILSNPHTLIGLVDINSKLYSIGWQHNLCCQPVALLTYASIKIRVTLVMDLQVDSLRGSFKLHYFHLIHLSSMPSFKFPSFVFIIKRQSTRLTSGPQLQPIVIVNVHFYSFSSYAIAIMHWFFMSSTTPSILLQKE